MTSFLLFDEYGPENCKIELIEEYPCQTKEQLTQREGHYIRTTECVNRMMSSATMTKSEINKRYREKNLEKIRERTSRYNREKYQQNPEFFIEKSKQYRTNNQDKIKAYTEKRKDQIKLYNKTHYENNREQINEKTRARDSERVECPQCGRCMRRDSMRKHIKNQSCKN